MIDTRAALLLRLLALSAYAAALAGSAGCRGSGAVSDPAKSAPGDGPDGIDYHPHAGADADADTHADADSDPDGAYHEAGDPSPADKDTPRTDSDTPDGGESGPAGDGAGHDATGDGDDGAPDGDSGGNGDGVLDPGDGDGASGDDDPSGVELNPGWIGGACATATNCSNADFSSTPVCLTSGFPNGMCSQACTNNTGSAWVCPDTTYGAATLATTTRCVNANGQPYCASECDFNLSATGCRPGYTCVLRERYLQPTRIFAVCLPSGTQRWPGEPAPANDIGSACASASDCESRRCLEIDGGYCTKTMCDLAGCPIGTSCFTFPKSGQEMCLADCQNATTCRTAADYSCDTGLDACWPDQVQAIWDPTVGAGDCATAWGVAGIGLSTCDTTKDDYIVIKKSARNIALCKSGKVVANFSVGLGIDSSGDYVPGDKEMEGDRKTPEGVFYVSQLLPSSSYYKAFLFSYPDKADAVRGLSAGIINATEKSQIDSAQNSCGTPPQTTGLGGYVEVHGNGGYTDWTWGCVALDDADIDTLWAAITTRDTVVILP